MTNVGQNYGFYTYFDDYLQFQKKHGKIKTGVWWQCWLRKLNVRPKTCGKPGKRLETKANPCHPCLKQDSANLDWGIKGSSMECQPCSCSADQGKQYTFILPGLQTRVLDNVPSVTWVGDTDFQSALNTNYVVYYNCLIISKESMQNALTVV